MSANPQYNNPNMAEAEYLQFEQDSNIRHEYLQGEVVAMAGASRKHNQITGALMFLLYGHLRNKDCEVYGGDMRVKIDKVDVQTYPDFSVFCGSPEFTDDPVPALLNPILIIEVLSPSTESYDRGKKFQYYRTIPSLQEYVLVSQDQAQVEKYVRQPNNRWELSDASGLEDHITLASIDCKLSLEDVYENVTFESEEGTAD
jgi:Uma2 family endonuclease